MEPREPVLQTPKIDEVRAIRTNDLYLIHRTGGWTPQQPVS